MSRLVLIATATLVLGALAPVVACSSPSTSDTELAANPANESDLTGAAAAPASAPPACYTASAAPTTCTAPALTAGSTTCDDAQITAFITACLVGSPDGGTNTCAEWLSGPGASACGGCLKAWSVADTTGAPAGLDTLACYYAQTPSCNTDIKCYFDCVDAVCGTCTTAADFKSCQASAKAGACAAKLTPAGSCAQSAPALSACSATTVAKAVGFYHGACVANAHWPLPDGGAP